MRVFRHSGEVVPFGPSRRERTVFETVRYIDKPRKGLRSFMGWEEFLDTIVYRTVQVLSQRAGEELYAFGPMIYHLDAGEETRITDGRIPPKDTPPDKTLTGRWYSERLGQTMWVYKAVPPTANQLQSLKEMFSCYDI